VAFVERFFHLAFNVFRGNRNALKGEMQFLFLKIVAKAIITATITDTIGTLFQAS
jgi:hypothetical protein